MSSTVLPLLPSSEAHTILVVDDEVLVRLVIAEYLRACGYTVHEAANADEAIAVVDSSDVVIDLVLADVQMPSGSLDGFGLARWVRKHHPEVKVILTSGAARSAEIAGDLCEHGPLLAKPYEPSAALDRIKQLLATVGRPLRALPGACSVLGSIQLQA
ncbi:MAG TPA: response regulator [Beijerinckiaceae bacterium]|jgi:CheY-like chemotaxis protein